MPATKADIVKAVYAKHGGLSYQEAKRAVDFMIDFMRRSLENDGKMLLSGFGAFEVVERKARKGRNPRTGDEIAIPPHRALAFRPSRQLKAAVNSSRGGASKGGKETTP